MHAIVWAQYAKVSKAMKATDGFIHVLKYDENKGKRGPQTELNNAPHKA